MLIALRNRTAIVVMRSRSKSRFYNDAESAMHHVITRGPGQSFSSLRVEMIEAQEA